MSDEDEDGLMSQINLVGVKLFSYVNAFFSSEKMAWMLVTLVKSLYRPFLVHASLCVYPGL